MAQTAAAIIRVISETLGDLYDGTITTSSATAPADTARTEPDNFWTGGNLAILDQAAAGTERRITGWTKLGGVFATNAFAVAPTNGSVYELRKRVVHTRAAILDYLNQAVREAQRIAWVRKDSVVDLADATLYDITKTEYAVPAGVEYVHAVLWQDTQTDVLNPTWYRLADAEWTTHGTGTVLLDVRDRDGTSLILDTSPLKFLGSRRPVEFAGFTSTSEIEGNFLLEYALVRACYRLASGASAQDAQAYRQMAADHQPLVEQARHSARLNLPAGSRRVR